MDQADIRPVIQTSAMISRAKPELWVSAPAAMLGISSCSATDRCLIPCRSQASGPGRYHSLVPKRLDQGDVTPHQRRHRLRHVCLTIHVVQAEQFRHYPRGCAIFLSGNCDVDCGTGVAPAGFRPRRIAAS